LINRNDRKIERFFRIRPQRSGRQEKNTPRNQLTAKRSKKVVSRQLSALSLQWEKDYSRKGAKGAKFRENSKIFLFAVFASWCETFVSPVEHFIGSNLRSDFTSQIQSENPKSTIQNPKSARLDWSGS
jgi:hypothetical protein